MCDFALRMHETAHRCMMVQSSLRVVFELLLLKNIDFVPLKSRSFVQDAKKCDFDMLNNL